MKSIWQVLVVYEDTRTREETVHVCDLLVERSWSRCRFDINWCSFSMLQESLPAREAIEKAIPADLVIFALKPEGEIPERVKVWIESWLELRGKREGRLVGLRDPGPGLSARTPEKYLYLRNVAHRAGMDYLTHVPETIGRAIPDSLESCSERADRVTSVLDEILHQKTLPAPPRLFS